MSTSNYRYWGWDKHEVVDKVNLDLESNDLLLNQTISLSKDIDFQRALSWSGNPDWIAEGFRLTGDLESCLEQTNALRTSLQHGQSIFDKYPRFTGQVLQRTYAEQVSLLKNGVDYLMYRFQRLHSEVQK
jgi:hypothetical protein